MARRGTTSTVVLSIAKSKRSGRLKYIYADIRITGQFLLLLAPALCYCHSSILSQ